MTVWLDVSWVRSQIAEPVSGKYEIIDNGVTGDRAEITVIFTEGFEFESQWGMDSWESLFSGLRTTNPNISVSAREDSVAVTITADSSAYRDEQEL